MMSNCRLTIRDLRLEFDMKSTASVAFLGPRFRFSSASMGPKQPHGTAAGCHVPCVVVTFSVDTPLKYIEILKPKLLVRSQQSQ